MGINTDLMYDVLLEATAFPEVHNQGTWAQSTACGTAYCMAGLAVAFTEDYTFNLHTAAEAPATGYAEDRCNCPECRRGRDVISEYGGVLPRGCTDWESEDRRISEVARETLGLTKAQAKEMFAACNSINDLWRFAAQFTNGDVVRPPKHVIDEYRMHGSRIKKIDARFFPEETA